MLALAIQMVKIKLDYYWKIWNRTLLILLGLWVWQVCSIFNTRSLNFTIPVTNVYMYMYFWQFSRDQILLKVSSQFSLKYERLRYIVPILPKFTPNFPKFDFKKPVLMKTAMKLLVRFDLDWIVKNTCTCFLHWHWNGEVKWLTVENSTYLSYLQTK